MTGRAGAESHQREPLWLSVGDVGAFGKIKLHFFDRERLVEALRALPRRIDQRSCHRWAWSRA